MVSDVLHRAQDRKRAGKATGEGMTPRVRAYAEQEAANCGAKADDVLGGSRAPLALTARRKLIVRLVNDGFKTTQIARWLRLHPATIRYHADPSYTATRNRQMRQWHARQKKERGW
jgi:DNA-binding NarL/FixJ family response regulator